MNRRLMKSLLALTCCLAGPGIAVAAPGSGSLPAARNVVQPDTELVLSVGRGQLVNLPAPITDFFIANESIADVQVKSNRQVIIFGKAGGETTVYTSNASGQVIWSAVVRVASNVESVDQMLAVAMPDAKIGVTTVGTGAVLLTGTVASPEDAAEAQRLVTTFLGEKANVVSRLKTATPLQVNLQVRIAEVSRSLVREMASNLTSRDSSGGFLFGLGRGRDFGNITVRDYAGSGFPMLDASSIYGLPAGSISLPFNPTTGRFIGDYTSFPQAKNNTSQSVLNLAGKLFGVNVAAAFDLSERVGLVTTLAQPNLTALSGETAEFLAGGEFPIPINQGLGTTTIEYKKYGVSLSYTPVVLANGRISLRVRPEVSELSSQGAISISGFQIPAMTVRRAETTVELGSGQSFMIAGLMSSNTQNTIEKTPGVGDLPILGSLFRSTNFQRGETELVIMVTPYLVNPVDAKDIKLPTDGFHAPDELQRILGNAAADGVSGQPRPGPSAAPDASAPASAPAAPALSAREERQNRKSRRNRTASASAAPGFNLD